LPGSGDAAAAAAAAAGSSGKTTHFGYQTVPEAQKAEKGEPFLFSFSIFFIYKKFMI
jgi:hypothetical protein